MYRIDLHTHSSASPDGGLSIDDYGQMLAAKKLDYIAVTDHGTIKMAIKLKENFGESIIVGQEIKTKEGEIIGLYLKTAIKDNLSLTETIRLIKEQKGLVYVPHPLEKIRSGINKTNLKEIIKHTDIIECFNGRAITKKYSNKTLSFAQEYRIPCCASSDAHGKSGWGRTYTIVKTIPNPENLAKLLEDAKFICNRPTIRAILYPKYNKLRKALL